MATLNEHTSVLAAILSDISDHSDMNLVYILLANKCQRQIRKHDRKNTLKQTKHQTKSQLVYKQTLGSHDYSCWDRSFLIPKNESVLVETNRLVKDCSRKSGSIQQRSLTKLAPGVSTLQREHWDEICYTEHYLLNGIKTKN